MVEKADEYANIADNLLLSAGFTINGEEKAVINCTFNNICNTLYPDNICDKFECRLLLDLQRNNLSPEIQAQIQSKLKLPALNINNININENVSVICPRSLKAKVKINKNCTNKSCPFYTKKLAFSCMLLHSRTFIPDEDVPRRVIEIGTGFSPRVLDRYNKISLYLLRMYLLVFKYCFENLKMDYSYTFQTKYIHELFQSQKGNNLQFVECCPKCNALITNKKEVKKKIGKTGHFFNTTEYHCNCSNPEILKLRQEATSNWVALLEKPRFEERQDYRKLSFRKMHSIYKDSLFTRSFMLLLLSNINIEGIKLKDVPLGYMLYAYTLMFGEFSHTSFGLSEKLGTKLYNLFVGEYV